MPAAAGGADRPPAAPDVGVCRQRFAARPDDRESARCFWLAGHAGDPRGAARAVDDLLRHHPENPGLALYAALLAPSARDESLLRLAAAGFGGRDPTGEFLARYNLVNLLLDQGRTDEAGGEIDRAAAAAARSEPRLRAHHLALARIAAARRAVVGGDLRRAGLILDAVPAGPLRDERWLVLANSVHAETGQLDRAWDDCLRLSAPNLSHLYRGKGFFCQARVLIYRTIDEPSAAVRARIESAARAAVAEAAAAGDRAVAVRAHWALIVLAPDETAAAAELQSCLALTPGASGASRPSGIPNAPGVAGASGAAGAASAQGAAGAAFDTDRGLCRAAFERRLAAAGKAPPPAIEQALAAQVLADPSARVQRDGDAMRRSWATRPFGDFLRDGRRTLAGIESLRAAQSTSTVRMGLFSTWSEDYYWFAGRLLETASRRPCGACLDEAFDTVERLRARDLDESLAGAATAGSGPRSLAEVQRRLGRDEALLSFQIAPWAGWTGDFGGGSWLLVATRDGRRAYRLGEIERGALRQAVADLTQATAEDYRRGLTVTLYRQLLAPALAGLPAGIARLIVVPDDELHRLPFAALRAAPGAPPLAGRYEIDMVPSASLWTRWRATPAPPPAARPALVLAAPPPPSAAARRSFRAQGIELPAAALPAARREAWDVVRYLGWQCARRVDGAATAAALTPAPGQPFPFALVHFAAHSIVDERDAERSGIWLAPTAGFAGLLQVPAIVRLRLDGRLVVLSTCSGNGGPLLHGEGVMSLAHAFFEARARVVVASLWPLADDDAAALLGGFYRHLAGGASVAAALRQAQIERWRGAPDAPLAAWAGMVVLGDGSLVPFPGGRHPWAAPGLSLAAGGILLALAFATLAARRRARAPSPA